MIRLIAVDDEPSVLEFIRLSLARPEIEIELCSAPEEGWNRIRARRPDIVMVDYQMPGVTGMELLMRIVEWDPAIEVVMLTSQANTDLAVTAIQRGASDFIAKPIGPAELRHRLEPLVESLLKRQRANKLQDELLGASSFNGLVGQSAPMLEVFALIRRVAPHFRSVLITGPTGTGKELVARAIHQSSPVSQRPFVVCNCAAIVETLFESELFGHVRGSFTGATVDRAGLFEAADGGTLFLDEIGEVPLKMQAKFLRALQNGEIQRVGSNSVRKVNVRVIAATNRELRTCIVEKEFREDLYYRLSMLEIRTPPLSERGEDLMLLQRYFLRKFGEQLGKRFEGVTRRAQILLSRHAWPGNVRELENVMGHACTMADGDMIDVADLPQQVRSGRNTRGSSETMSLDEVVANHVRVVYESSGQNKLLTAEILGISRATLYRYLGVNAANAGDK